MSSSTATISELIIAASVDPSGIKQGLDRGVGHIQEFAGTIESALDQLPKFASTSGVSVATAILQSATATFRANNQRLKEDFFSGALSEAQFKAEGTKLAQGFNASLVGGLQLLRSQMGVTATETLDILASKFKTAGALNAAAYEATFRAEMLRGEQETAALVQAERARITEAASRGFGTAMRQGFTNANIALEETSVLATGVRMRLNSIAVGAAFAFEAMEQGGARGEGAMRRVLRGVGLLSLAIGEPLIAAGALMAGALMDHFTKVERAAEKAAEKIREAFASAANASSFENLREIAKTNWTGQLVSMGEDGKPQTNKDGSVKLNKRSQYASDAFEGSLKALLAEQTALEERITHESGQLAGVVDMMRLKVVKDQVAPLAARDRELKLAIAQITGKEPENAGFLAEQRIEASKGDSGKTKDVKPFKDLTSEVGELTRAIDLMEQHGETVGANIYAKLVAKRAEIASLLRSQAPGSEGRNELLAADNDAMNALGVTADKVSERYKTMQAATGQWSNETQGALRVVAAAHDAITTAIMKQGGPLMASKHQLQDQAVLAGALADQYERIRATIMGATKASAEQTSPLGVLSSSVGANADAVSRATAMKQLGLPGGDEAMEKALRQREALKQALKDALAVERLEGETQGEYEKRLERIVALWKILLGDVKATHDTFSNIATLLHGMADAFTGLGGKLGQGLGQAITGALHAAEAIKKMQKESKEEGGLGTLGALAGGIGVAGGVISAISGLSAMLNQHDAALDANTQRLSELRASLEQTRGITGQTSALSVINDLVAKGFTFSELSKDFAAFDASLRSAGLTIDQVKKMASDLGITLDGDVSHFAQFAEALRLNIEAQRKYNSSLTDQQSLSALHDKVYGLNAPGDQLSSTLKLLTQFAPNLGKMFDGINTATSAGQIAFKGALQKLFDMLAGGSLTPADFGALNGAKDLGGIISTLMDSFNALTNAANSAAGSLSYVPTGYKVALARFNAMDARPVPAPVAPGTGGGGGSTSSPTGQVSGAAGATPLVINGPIMIDARDKSAEELFNAILGVAQRASQSLYGRTDRWANVQTQV